MCASSQMVSREPRLGSSSEIRTWETGCKRDCDTSTLSTIRWVFYFRCISLLANVASQNQSIDNSKPYSPPVFAEMLRIAFFKRQTSFGFKISQQFVSSLPDKPDEQEIPAAMLALVATAVMHCVLWSFMP